MRRERRPAAASRRARPRAAPAAPSASVRAASSASRSCSSPAVSRAPIGVLAREITGPVSRPASIRITLMPVVASRARIARWIGAAPRQRGSSDACRFTQPSRGHASTARGSSSPYAITIRRSGARRRARRATPACAASRGCTTAQAVALRGDLHGRCGEPAAAPGGPVGLREHDRHARARRDERVQRRDRELGRAGESDARAMLRALRLNAARRPCAGSDDGNGCPLARGLGVGRRRASPSSRPSSSGARA